MAIPPIITNNPILKLLKSEASQQAEGENSASPTIEDIVEISEFAKARLEGIETLSADNSERINEVAQETSEILSDNESLDLGLDPAFNE